jgi:xanthine dehydrogenase small subunit
MLQFILNDKLIHTDLPSGSTVLDLVRYNKRLMGTKIGCREGDCGACTILVGDLVNDKLVYRSMTSCLMPLGNAAGKHIVTVEGINGKELSPVQQAMVECNGTQCGFCTPGFIMSLTGFVLDESAKEYNEAIAAIDGNICRCTGYKSIERAAAMLSEKMHDKPGANTISWLVQHHFIPAYFSGIQERLRNLKRTEEVISSPANTLMLAGGTDLVVQKALQVKKSGITHLYDTKNLQGISIENGFCHIGGAVTVTAFAESAIVQEIFPQLHSYMKLLSSTPIRNMATMAGNIVNASPIGDMSIFFLALDASIILVAGETNRSIRLRDLYKGYKQLDKTADELVEKIIFKVPKQNSFSFEKVSKRTHLDIASVNSACSLSMNDDATISYIHLSAGGVAPFPKYLGETCSFLTGKIINQDNLAKAIDIMNKEIAPISDARGSAEYKRLLLRQLFLAHFQHMDQQSNSIIKKILQN